MASLRTLLNIVGPDEVTGLAGPVEGRSHNFVVTCFNCNNGSYADFCCMSFIVDSTTTKATFEVWGGGGGGGGFCCCGTGPGGSSGSYTRKTQPVESGQCYAMILGRSTDCASSPTGCAGCWSCLCGVSLNGTAFDTNMCAQGGTRGCATCFYTGCCNYCTCEGVPSAYGGTENIDGVRSCLYHRCHDNACWDKLFVAYPGGITNKCGGVLMSRPHDHYWYAGWAQCLGSYLSNPVGGGGRGFGYIPGMGGPSGFAGSGVCRCGTPGTPGMIKVTFA